MERKIPEERRRRRRRDHRLEWRPQSFEVGALEGGREKRKAGSPFSTVGGPRPHSRNRLQNVLFTWFEGAPSRVFFFFFFFAYLSISLVPFSRVLILFSHTFFFSFSFILSSSSSNLNQFSEPEELGGGVVARCDFGTTFATSATVRVAQIRNEGTVVQVDDLLERVLKVSHSLGIVVIKRHDIEQFSKEKIIDRILSNR